MPKRHPHDYEPVLSARAMETFLELSKAKQRKLAKLLYDLASPPFREPDYITYDSVGRALSNAVFKGYAVTYWLDGHPQELRVVDLVQL